MEPDEGFLGVGGKDAEVEVVLFEDELDELGPRLTADDIEYDFGDEDEEEAAYEPPEAGSARLREFLSVVLGHLRVDAKLHIVETAEEITAELSGDDLGVVIGKRGQTLDAIEYLASIVLYPHPDARKRIEIDAEGYKARRQAAIERIAFRKAQEVAKRGQAAAARADDVGRAQDRPSRLARPARRGHREHRSRAVPRGDHLAQPLRGAAGDAARSAIRRPRRRSAAPVRAGVSAH